MRMWKCLVNTVQFHPCGLYYLFWLILSLYKSEAHSFKIWSTLTLLNYVSHLALCSYTSCYYLFHLFVGLLTRLSALCPIDITSIWELQMFQISPSFQYPFSPYNMFWSHQSHSWPHALPHLYGLWIYLWSYHCLLTFQFWLKPLGRREDNLDPQTQAQVWHWHHYICVIECLINT